MIFLNIAANMILEDKDSLSNLICNKREKFRFEIRKGQT